MLILFYFRDEEFCFFWRSDNSFACPSKSKSINKAFLPLFEKKLLSNDGYVQIYTRPAYTANQPISKNIPVHLANYNSKKKTRGKSLPELPRNKLGEPTIGSGTSIKRALPSQDENKLPKRQKTTSKLNFDEPTIGSGTSTKRALRSQDKDTPPKRQKTTSKLNFDEPTIRSGTPTKPINELGDKPVLPSKRERPVLPIIEPTIGSRLVSLPKTDSEFPATHWSEPVTPLGGAFTKNDDSEVTLSSTEEVPEETTHKKSFPPATDAVEAKKYFEKMSLSQLKDELKKRGLPVEKDKKQSKINRLADFVQKRYPELEIKDSFAEYSRKELKQYLKEEYDIKDISSGDKSELLILLRTQEPKIVRETQEEVIPPKELKRSMRKARQKKIQRIEERDVEVQLIPEKNIPKKYKGKKAYELLLREDACTQPVRLTLAVEGIETYSFLDTLTEKYQKAGKNEKKLAYIDIRKVDVKELRYIKEESVHFEEDDEGEKISVSSGDDEYLPDPEEIGDDDDNYTLHESVRYKKKDWTIESIDHEQNTLTLNNASEGTIIITVRELENNEWDADFRIDDNVIMDKEIGKVTSIDKKNKKIQVQFTNQGLVWVDQDALTKTDTVFSVNQIVVYDFEIWRISQINSNLTYNLQAINNSEKIRQNITENELQTWCLLQQGESFKILKIQGITKHLKPKYKLLTEDNQKKEYLETSKDIIRQPMVDSFFETGKIDFKKEQIVLWKKSQQVKILEERKDYNFLILLADNQTKIVVSGRTLLPLGAITTNEQKKLADLREQVDKDSIIKFEKKAIKTGDLVKYGDHSDIFRVIKIEDSKNCTLQSVHDENRIFEDVDQKDVYFYKPITTGDLVKYGDDSDIFRVIKIEDFKNCTLQSINDEKRIFEDVDQEDVYFYEPLFPNETKVVIKKDKTYTPYIVKENNNGIYSLKNNSKQFHEDQLVEYTEPLKPGRVVKRERKMYTIKNFTFSDGNLKYTLELDGGNETITLLKEQVQPYDPIFAVEEEWVKIKGDTSNTLYQIKSVDKKNAMYKLEGKKESFFEDDLDPKPNPVYGEGDTVQYIGTEEEYKNKISTIKSVQEKNNTYKLNNFPKRWIKEKDLKLIEKKITTEELFGDIGDLSEEEVGAFEEAEEGGSEDEVSEGEENY